MNKQLLNRLVKKFSKNLSRAYDFALHSSTTLVKNCNSILHIISFDLPPSGLYCNIAVLPIYFPINVISYDVGNRLNHFKVNLSGNWCNGDTEDELLRDLDEIQKLIEINVLPWFNEVSDPVTFIEMLESELSPETQSVTMCPPHLDYLYIGFSYLFLKEYEQAKTALKKALQRSMEYAPNLLNVNPWCLIRPNLKLLEDKQTEIIEANLQAYVKQTCINLKLE
ncbi:DUF4304 domain-containing protein [Christensenellaceae bacterium OttesenSCG-928-M15]|nr:DUF4304 domain-containing protein [Christensenellaceae bacterium OttesenSCG-928-M15]